MAALSSPSPGVRSVHARRKTKTSSFRSRPGLLARHLAFGGERMKFDERMSGKQAPDLHPERRFFVHRISPFPLLCLTLPLPNNLPISAGRRPGKYPAGRRGFSGRRLVLNWRFVRLADKKPSACFFARFSPRPPWTI
jgi:hypothetical protein